MTTVEEAFDLARSGEYRSIPDITKALRSRGHPVGFIEDHLIGKQIRAELTRACREASSGTKEGPDEAVQEIQATLLV